jgi:rhodanese-related sulfurtransferase
MPSAHGRPGGASAIATDTSPNVILDVRSRHEYDSGHVPGARHLPFWKVLTSVQTIVPSREHPVTVYCGHGPRAWMAGALLRLRGYRHVCMLAGHMRRWKQDGKPLE